MVVRYGRLGLAGGKPKLACSKWTSGRRKQRGLSGVRREMIRGSVSRGWYGRKKGRRISII